MHAINIRGYVFLSLVFCIVALLLAACTNTGYVVATTATTIGVEIGQDQTTGAPSSVLGYKRAEGAFLPTNRGTADKTTTTLGADGKPANTVQENGVPTSGQGARDSANVLMELHYKGIFSSGEGSGIYQRLAVGDIAVAQPGAAAMFAKDDAGKIDSNAAVYLAKANTQLIKENSQLDKIIGYVSSGSDTVDKAALQTLLDAAKSKNQKALSDSTVTSITGATGSGKTLRKNLSDINFAVIPLLYAELPADKQ